MQCAPSTLFSRYSMLKAGIQTYDNINISTYKSLIAFLKKRNVGFIPKKSKTLTAEDITRLCNETDDPDWLVIKVNFIKLYLNISIDS